MIDENMACCPKCNRLREFYYKFSNMSHTFQEGDTYRFKGKMAICKVCGCKYLGPHGLQDYNVHALYAVYRRKNGIISAEDVHKLAEVYAIDKIHLAVLLDVDVDLFSKWYDGKVPSRTCSDLMKMLLVSPSAYLELLEKNKDKLPDIAYQKSLKAVNDLLPS